MREEFQNTFVQLAADEVFRAAFFDNAEQALRGRDLTRHERRALQGIPQPALERYAQSLLAKRSREFEQTIPLTLRACPSVPARYRRWLARHPVPHEDRVLSPGLSEAMRALPTLRHAVDADPAEASYAGDVLAFEILAKASRLDGQERALTARYRVDDIVRDLRRNVLAMDPDTAPTRFHFRREGIEWRRIAHR